MGPGSTNPLAGFLAAQGKVILDGGLATTLEAGGLDLDDPLWSARALVECPDRIRAAHLAFLEAGADCIATASYQASVPGFLARGVEERDARALLASSVEIARDARDRFWSDAANRRGRLRPLVAASVGPYGAFLADGSEYTGDYGLDGRDLLAFHRGRWHVLAEAAPDLLACETIPSLDEVRVLLGLLDATPDVWAWMSLSCRDERHLADGTPVAAAAAACHRAPRIAALSVNCVTPRWVPGLMAELRRETDKPLLVYPNSGERYEARTRSWGPGSGETDWADAAQAWVALGAAGVGGCCRVGPETVRILRRALVTSQP